MSQLSYVAENVLVSECKLDARTKLKKRFCIAFSVRGLCLGVLVYDCKLHFHTAVAVS